MCEAVFSQSDYVEVTAATIQELIREARLAPRGRFRLCMHCSTQDQVQEMVIVAPRGAYTRPHRHPAGKTESYHVIEGAMSVFFFNDDGEVIKRIDMEAYGFDKTYLYRLNSSIWHIPVPTSEFVVFHEVLAGPFSREETCEYAPFSPDETEIARVDAFLEKIMKNH